MNKIKEKFIKDLIQKLNRENTERINEGKDSLNVCYMTSVIDQNIDKCNEFMEDIKNNDYYFTSYQEDVSGGYTGGYIGIGINASGINYTYRIDFGFEICDWYIPTFNLIKEINVLYSGYNGGEQDYDEYEKQFNQNEENANKDVKEHKRQIILE